jgi:subtilisin family serine protease/subtilisin-like proprotein convertase family protein
MRNTATGRGQPLLLEVLEDRTLPSAGPGIIDLSGLNVDTSHYNSSDILVELRAGSVAPRALLAGTTIARQLGLVSGLYEVDLAPGVTVGQALAVYSANPSVVAAEPDYRLVVQGGPNDPSFGQQWALQNTGQNGGIPGDDIGALKAWSVTTGSPTVTVAVIDTGIDYNHPDLYGNIWINQAEIPKSRLANLVDVDHDGIISFADLNDPINQGPFKITDINQDGRIDAADILAPMVLDAQGNDTGQGGWAYPGNTQDGDTAHPNDFIGWNFVNNTNNPFDDNNHGTHVSGIIGAMGNNGVGVAGVEWQASLMAVKFLNQNGGGSLGAFIDGLNYSVKHGAQISNNSWSGAPGAQILSDAINSARSAGQIFVASAANGATNTDVNPAYPSSFPIDNIVSVAATNSSNQLAGFSNYGVKTVSLAAPGVGILSTLPGGTYQSWDGTSMAAPFVTGVLALVWSQHPSWSYQQVIAQVEKTVTAVPGLQGKVATGGIVNAAAAVGYQQPNLPTPQVLATVASGPAQNSLSTVRVSFSLPIDVETLVNSAVTLTGPNGKAIPIMTIKPVPNSGSRQFDIGFATQTAGGSYTFAITSAVHDTDGRAVPGFRTAFTLLSVNTFSSSGNVPIPKPSKVSSFITVNQDITISQVQVLVNVSYSNDSDLYIHLTSPSGTDILLSNRRGGAGHDFARTLFTDDATVPIGSGVAPFSGSFRPEAPLSNLNTENARGTWRLWVEDRGAGHGVINGWSLVIAGAPVAGSARRQSVQEDGEGSPGLARAMAASRRGSADVAGVAATVTPDDSDLWRSLPDAGRQMAAPPIPVLVEPAGAGARVADEVFMATDSSGEIRAFGWLSRLASAVGDDAFGAEDAGALEEDN